jgi:AcrR family transcriptional regulator
MSFEGLRELKKRATRQRISDVATEMFLARGFESVAVTEVAAAAGVSEKTVYNYFPTKESLVLDQTEGQVERLIGAVRDRPKGVPPTAALVAALKEDSSRFYEMIPAEHLPRIEEFGAMVRSVPALRAAWSEHRHHMVAALTQVLADELKVDDRTPEPLVAARALIGLVELLYDSRLRHSSAGHSPAEVAALVDAAAGHRHVVAASDGRGAAQQGPDPRGGGACRAGTPSGADGDSRREASLEGDPRRHACGRP